MATAAWTTVAFSIADHAPRGLRAQVRAELEMLRFAPLHDGLWVSPVPPSAALRAVLTANRAVSSTIIHGTADTNAGLRPPIAAWDLAGLRRVYDDFLAAFEPLHARLHRDGLDDREALVARVRVAYRWFVIATTDPDLPAELLPANWPRNDAHAIYADLFDLLGPPAADRVRHIFSQRAPSLAALVAHAPRHQTG